jgi:cell division protein FtsX
LQYEKQYAERVSTNAGIEIDVSNEQPKNALSPTIESFESVSNVTFDSSSQVAKQHLAMVVTDEGMQIDTSDEQSENADSPRVDN